MDNGGLNANTAATLALLTDTARAGRGGYGMGGGEGGFYGGPYATPSAIQHGIANNRQFAENDADCTRSVLGLGLDRISNDFVNATRSREFTSVKDGQFSAELRTNDRLLALQAEINANARTADKCCADIQLNQCKDTAAIMARMEAISKEGISRDLDRAERELIALKTQVACGCVSGCSTPCAS